MRVTRLHRIPRDQCEIVQRLVDAQVLQDKASASASCPLQSDVTTCDVPTSTAAEVHAAVSFPAETYL